MWIWSWDETTADREAETGFAGQTAGGILGDRLDASHNIPQSMYGIGSKMPYHL
jgi:hypothetical protein